VHVLPFRCMTLLKDATLKLANIFGLPVCHQLYINFLLTECEVCRLYREISDWGIFLYRPNRYGEVCTKRPRSDIFLLVKCLLYGIYCIGIYIIETNEKCMIWNAWPVHIWSKKTKMPMYSFFFTKNHSQISY
jgi:hypothetical protein